MGLLQRAVETYEYHNDLVGVYREGHVPLAPMSHMITSANIEISINKNGEYLSSRLIDKNEPKVIIPVTDESSGRTSAPSAHPLCDQLCYIAQNDSKRYLLYVDELEKWSKSEYAHSKLTPILKYVRTGNILKDLLHEEIIQLNDDGSLKDPKLLVVWRIVGSEGEETTWKDKSLFEAFISYYASLHNDDKKILCMVSGQESSSAMQHPKGVFSLNGNAKLISANDNNGFTYRGRFTDDSQAVTVSYDASQKAHHALRWLISEQGLIYGGRVFLCWNPRGKRLKRPEYAFLNSNEAEIITPSAYKDKLNASLMSFQRDNQLSEKDTAVIAAFDAATTGRLALTYYSEMPATDFLKRLADWDQTCCWVNGSFGVQSPTLINIVNYAFGTQRIEKNNVKMETDNKIFRHHIERLLASKLNGQKIPIDVVRALTQRASSLQNYDVQIREMLLFITCAVLRKFKLDQLGEEWLMALDTENTNRSYLFGRLLAIAEKVEQDTYDGTETRVTNAIKLQSVFSRRPLYAWRIIEEALNPYYQRLRPGSRQYYKTMIGEITDLLESNASELDQPLEDVYLLGYYNQRQALYTKRSTETTEQGKEEE